MPLEVETSRRPHSNEDAKLHSHNKSYINTEIHLFTKILKIS